MRIDPATAQAVVSLRTNRDFIVFIQWLSKRGEDNTKNAIYADGATAAVARGMARESIEILKGIESSVSIIKKLKEE